MKKHRLFFLLLVPFFVFGVSSQSALSTTIKNVDKIKAVVNDEVITQNELNQKLALVKKQLSQAHQPIPAEPEFSKTILDGIIYSTLQIQLAKRMGIKISDAEVDETLSNIAKKNNLTLEQMTQEMKKEHIDLAAFREQLRNELLFTRLQEQFVSKDTDITEQEVVAYLNAHPTIDTPKPSAKSVYMLQDLLITFPDKISPATIAAIKTQVTEAIKEAGSDIKQIATKFAQNYKVKINDLGWRRLEDLPDLFAKELKKVRNTNITGPLEAPNGIHILKIIEMHGAAAGVEKKALTKDQALQLLWREKMGEKTKAWLEELKSKAYIKINE